MNLQEEYELGQKFLNSFTKESIFDGIKDIVKRYIQDEEDLQSLENCDSYVLTIKHGYINSLQFLFDGYKIYFYTISIDTNRLQIECEKQCAPYPTEILKIPTYKLIQQDHESLFI